MKQILFTALFLCTHCSTTFAQIVIQQSDFAISTTNLDIFHIKKTIKSNVKLPVGGNNQIWDYSNLRDSITTIFSLREVTLPVTIPRPLVFKTAQLQSFAYRVLQGKYGEPSWKYFKIDSSGFYCLGDSSLFTSYSITGIGSDSLIVESQIREYKPALLYYKFPILSNTVWKNNSRFVTNYRLKVGDLGLFDTPAQHVLITSTTDSVVGWGTLKMRSPSTGMALNFNALLVSGKFIETDSFYLNGSIASSELMNKLRLTQGRKSTENSLYFLGTNFKAPHLLFYHDGVNIEDIYRALLPNIGLTVTNKELSNLEISTTVFPNPAVESVTFEFEKTSVADWRVFIYNEIGQIIKNDYINLGISKIQHSIRFNPDLPNGTYFYQIIDDNSLIRNQGKLILHHK